MNILDAGSTTLCVSLVSYCFASRWARFLIAVLAEALLHWRDVDNVTTTQSLCAHLTNRWLRSIKVRSVGRDRGAGF